jgi:hypothetical protein
MKKTVLWLVLLTACLAPFAAQAEDASQLASVGFNVHGYYRARYFNYFDLSWISKEKGDDSDWWSWIDQRLVLQPTLVISDPIQIVTEMNILDNVMWGDNTLNRQAAVFTTRKPNDLETIDNVKAGTLDFNAGNLFSQSMSDTTTDRTDINPIEFRQLFARILLPVGYLQIGRQGSHFGMGLFSNSGSPYSRFMETPGDVTDRNSGFDSNGGDFYDRVLFASRIAGFYYPMVVYDRIAEDSFKTGTNDVNAFTLVNLFRGIRFADSGQFDGGFFIQGRGQHSTDGNVWIYDVWARLGYAGFLWETEALALQGHAKFIDHDTVEDLKEQGLPTGQGGGQVSADAYLAAFRFKYDSGRWSSGFEYGFSSPADPNPDHEFDAQAAANLEQAKAQLSTDPDNPNQKIDFTSAVVQNQRAFGRQLRTFNFDPEYKIDLITWDQLMGGALENGMYFKAGGYIRPLDGMHIQLDVINSYINEAGRSKNGGEASHDLGWETDLNFSYTAFKQFTSGLSIGYMLPGQYFRDVYRHVDNVYTMQIRTIVNF